MNEDGNFVEIVEAYFVDGTEVTEEEYNDLLPGSQPGAMDEVGVAMLGAKNCGAWPVLSDAFGVHPSQVEAAEAACRAQGVPCEYTRDGTGRAIFTSQQHMRDVLRNNGMHHKQDVGGGQSRTYKPTIKREDYV